MLAGSLFETMINLLILIVLYTGTLKNLPFLESFLQPDGLGCPKMSF
jgi:hypothetical protein